MDPFLLLVSRYSMLAKNEAITHGKADLLLKVLLSHAVAQSNFTE